MNGTNLEYVRLRVLDGELWRLLTASLTHINLNHLLLNLCALATLLLIAYRLDRLQAALIVLPLVCILSNTLLLLFPSLDWYRGLSGGLYGLAAFLIVGMLGSVQHRRLGAVALVVLTAKCAADALTDSARVSAIIGARVAWEAHLTGCVAGMAMAYAEVVRRRHSDAALN